MHLRNRNVVIGAGGYWLRVVADGIGSHGALTTRRGNVFCLKCDKKPAENFELADNMISSGMWYVHCWSWHCECVSCCHHFIPSSHRPMWWSLWKEIIPNLIRGRTLQAGVIFSLFGKDLGFLTELWTIFSDGLERNLVSFWEVRLTPLCSCCLGGPRNPWPDTQRFRAF